MSDPATDAAEFSRRINRLCLDQSRKMLELQKACAAASTARDAYAALRIYRQTQQSLRIAQETCAQVVACVADFVSAHRPRR
ncbi:hypothetical protein OPKNFCMD_2534 [Methylobacterium crusticola]|uniref:EscE/YscE/SsaE family type III secretion system needle protein co-chaperone n=1 Tax=Methylobacterium crusticola TaxID=1697972 RepID=A0ABQ4QWP3_9HYPH|nr:hypothetical protein [Methylobacterium crusticola]GJD49800.1 hypothetical protein OPKNFCMD_2534 [Methylobacterium crusticola]